MSEYSIKGEPPRSCTFAGIPIPDYSGLERLTRCRDCAHFRKVRMCDGTETARCSI